MVKATAVTDAMLLAAARALAATVPASDVAAGVLYPSLKDMRRTTLLVATAVGAAAFGEGVAGIARPMDLTRYVADRMYWPGGEEPAGWGAVVEEVAREVGES